MLFAEKISKNKNIPTNYTNVNVVEFVKNLQSLVLANKNKPKLTRPLFKFQFEERITILDFDSKTEVLNLPQIEKKCFDLFGNSILFTMISPSNLGLKIAVAVNLDCELSDLRPFLLASFNNIDSHAIGFKTNCFLGNSINYCNTDYTRFEVPKQPKKQFERNSNGVQTFQKLTLFEIATKYPQTSNKANKSVNSFLCSAFARGYEYTNVVSFAENTYNTAKSEIERMANTAYAKFAKTYTEKISQNKPKTSPFVCNDISDARNKYATFLKEFELNTQKFAAVQGQTALGKTHGFVHNLTRFVLAVPTIALANQVGKKYGLTSVTGAKSSDDLLEIAAYNGYSLNKVVCTYEQIRHFDLSNAVLGIDECHELVNAITYRLGTINRVTENISKAKKVLYVSATLPKTYLTLKGIEPTIFEINENVQRNVKHNFYKGDANLLLNEIKGKYQNTNKKVLVFFNNKEKIENAICDENTSGIYNFEGLEQSLPYIELIENSKLAKNLTIVTSKINAGVNISEKDTDFVVIYIADKANQIGINAADVCQFFGRIREANSVEFQIFERKRESENTSKEWDALEIKDFIAFQKNHCEGLNKGFIDIENSVKSDLHAHGFFYEYCVTLNTITKLYELSFEKIAHRIEYERQKSVSIVESLPLIDSRYFVETSKEFTDFGKSEKQEKDLDAEILLVNSICESVLGNTDHCKFIAKQTKSQKIKAVFKPNPINVYDKTHIKQQIILLSFYCDLIELDFTHKQILESFKGKSITNIEKFVSDSTNFWFYTTNAKLLPLQKKQKTVITKIAHVLDANLGKFLTAKELIYSVKECFDMNQSKYNFSFRDLSIDNIRKIAGFYANIRYVRSEKRYTIEMNENFFEAAKEPKKVESIVFEVIETEPISDIQTELEQVNYCPF